MSGGTTSSYEKRNISLSTYLSLSIFYLSSICIELKKDINILNYSVSLQKRNNNNKFHFTILYELEINCILSDCSHCSSEF